MSLRTDKQKSAPQTHFLSSEPFRHKLLSHLTLSSILLSLLLQETDIYGQYTFS